MKKLNFDENYDNNNDLINKYSQYSEIDKENIDKNNSNKYIIDNIIIETTLSNGKEIPEKIIFTTLKKIYIAKIRWLRYIVQNLQHNIYYYLIKW